MTGKLNPDFVGAIMAAGAACGRIDHADVSKWRRAIERGIADMEHQAIVEVLSVVVVEARRDGHWSYVELVSALKRLKNFL